MDQQEVTKTLKRLGWIALVFLVIGIVVSAIEKKQATKTVAVEVNIQHLPDGNDLITKGDVLTLLDRSFGFSMEGIPQDIVNVERIERVLEEDPFVLNADAFIDARNVVQIEITQRIPVIRIIDKMELSYYLDKDGNRLPLSKHFTARVLIATGNIPPHIPDFLEREQHLLYQIFELSKKILNDAFFYPMIEQIYVNNNKEFILIPKLGNQTILFGRYENVAIKLENLKIFYQKAIAEEGWRKYKTINLKFKGQVVAEKR